jgi:hypothetical protein
VKGCCTGPDRG